MSLTFLAMLQQAYATGWLVAAPIGPVNLEIIRRALGQRVLAGFLVGCGATCVDATYLILFSAGFGQIMRIPAISTVTFLIGGGFLCWIGAGALKDARAWWAQAAKETTSDETLMELSSPASKAQGQPDVPAPRSRRHSLWGCYLTGLGMTASNPMTLAFWSALSLQFAVLPPSHRIAASLAVWAGAFSWICLLMILLAFVRRWVGARLFSWVCLIGGAVVLYYGLLFLWRGAGVERFLPQLV